MNAESPNVEVCSQMAGRMETLKYLINFLGGGGGVKLFTFPGSIQSLLKLTT